MLQVKPLSTSIFRHEISLCSFIVDSLKGEHLEGKILAITSKIVSLAEKRRIAVSDVSKEQLVRQEADHYIGETRYGCHLTLKEGLLLPSAGIDESNSETGDYILFPVDPFSSAKKIHQELKQRLFLNQFGIILTDSHTTPLRRGVSGVALSYYGFRGVENHVGKEDLFGRRLEMTQINVADALAVAAVLTMGEGGEGRPLAIINYEVHFIEQESNDELKIPPEEDLYWPLLHSVIQED